MICPVKIYKLYTSKLDPRCDSLWQKPRRICGSITYHEPTWYEQCPVGHTPLEKFMGVLSDNLKLSYHYTNHCIRVIGMTLLNE